MKPIKKSFLILNAVNKECSGPHDLTSQWPEEVVLSTWFWKRGESFPMLRIWRKTWLFFGHERWDFPLLFWIVWTGLAQHLMVDDLFRGFWLVIFDVLMESLLSYFRVCVVQRGNHPTSWWKKSLAAVIGLYSLTMRCRNWETSKRCGTDRLPLAEAQGLYQ